MQHKTLAKKGWGQLSLAEQLGNIGSEISRAIHWNGKDENLFKQAVERALELFDLTLDDPRWIGHSPYRSLRRSAGRQEIARVREVFCDTVFGDQKYSTTLADLLRYFDQFAYLARFIFLRRDKIDRVGYILK